MKKTLINDPYRNPFHNRFHVPVHSRLDEMQSYTNVVWLDEKTGPGEKPGTVRRSRPRIAALAGAFALVLAVAFSAAFLSRLLSN
ncbi:MAG TPA: hypothetical protein VJ306_20520 [Pyrinomonadaceae bacterium]|jgi:hypothetical protein|nr:hypothetical protein [Pyrinomonadaceae bacterium]